MAIAKDGDSKMETIKMKIVGRTAKSMFDIIRTSGKVSFANDVVGLRVKRIVDGDNRKIFLPDGKYHHTLEYPKGDFIIVDLEDDSSYTIEVDNDNNTLIFKFNTTSDKLTGIRETVLSFINYNYGVEG